MGCFFAVVILGWYAVAAARVQGGEEGLHPGACAQGVRACLAAPTEENPCLAAGATRQADGHPGPTPFHLTWGPFPLSWGDGVGRGLPTWWCWDQGRCYGPQRGASVHLVGEQLVGQERPNQRRL